MARKASAESESSRGFNDIIGVVLMGFAVLLLAALLSYQPARRVGQRRPAERLGAQLDWPVRRVAGVWLLPGIGAAAFVAAGAAVSASGWAASSTLFAYLRRRWVWAVVLLLCCMGLLDLYRDHLENLQRNLDARLPAASSAAT